MSSIECPVCGQQQPSATIEAHINRCLDSGGVPAAPSPAPAAPAPSPAAKRPAEANPFGSPEQAPERKAPAQDLINFEPINGPDPEAKAVMSLLNEEAARRKREEEENERLLREFLAAEEKARLADAERAAEQVSCTCSLCKASKGIEEFFYFDACPHSFCKACLKADLLNHCTNATPSKAACQTCGAKFAQREIKELLGADMDKYDAACIKETISSNPNLVTCPKCNNPFERLAAKPADINQKETTADGKPLTKEALIHKSEYRFNCRECRAVFCASCKVEPYHLGFTCDQYKASLVADHCRFCAAIVAKGETVCA